MCWCPLTLILPRMLAPSNVFWLHFVATCDRLQVLQQNLFFFLFYYSDAHRDDFLKRPDVPAHLVTLKCLWVHCLTNTIFPHLDLCVNEKELLKDFSTNDFTAILTVIEQFLILFLFYFTNAFWMIFTTWLS